MGVDDPERRFLALEIGEDPHQERVFHDVGEIAGVEGMPIIHRSRSATRDLSPLATAFAIDLRALSEIAQVPIHADANLLEHPPPAGDRHHLGPQSRIGL